MDKIRNLEKSDSVKELSLFELTTTDGGYWWRISFNAMERFIFEMLVDAHNNPIRPSEYR